MINTFFQSILDPGQNKISLLESEETPNVSSLLNIYKNCFENLQFNTLLKSAVFNDIFSNATTTEILSLYENDIISYDKAMTSDKISFEDLKPIVNNSNSNSYILSFLVKYAPKDVLFDNLDNILNNHWYNTIFNIELTIEENIKLTIIKREDEPLELSFTVNDDIFFINTNFIFDVSIQNKTIVLNDSPARFSFKESSTIKKLVPLFNFLNRQVTKNLSRIEKNIVQNKDVRQEIKELNEKNINPWLVGAVGLLIGASI